MTDSSSIAKDIGSNLLRRYLIGRGWLPSPSGRKFELYTLPGEKDDAPVEIVLPVDSESRALHRGVEDALRTLSQLEDKSVEDIASDIRGIAADVIRNVIPDHYVVRDSIELRVARAFTRGFREFLATAASAELKPLPFHSRILKEGKEYADNCRFGHTFRGSFGFTIESPVGLNDEPQVIEGITPPPFSRRVIERIARGLQAVDRASANENPSVISDHYDTGMSANMCDSLALLIRETGVASQDITIKFSREWSPSAGLSTETRLPITLQHVGVLKEAASELRKGRDAKPTVIVGRVVALETEGNPSDLLKDSFAREVVINWMSPEGYPVRVHVLLAPRDYLTALEAHKSGANIQVRGIVEGPRRKQTLRSPEGFALAPGFLK